MLNKKYFIFFEKSLQLSKMGVYLHQQNSKTMKSQIKIRQEWRALNLEINSQLKMAGKPLSQLPDSEWKQWIIELMNYRDTLTPLVK